MIPVEFNGRYYGKMKGIAYLSDGEEVLVSTSSGDKFVASIESVPDKESISAMSLQDILQLKHNDITINASKKTISGTKLTINVSGKREYIRIMKEISVKPLN